MVGKKRRRSNDRKSEVARFLKLRMAAERGDAEAQHDLGAFYATDELLGLKDEAKAIEWYTRAAERGHALSQYDLGFMLLLGEGMEKDLAKGLWWMEQAVANGWEYAAKVLCDVYREGMFDVKLNLEKAAYWNEKAGSFKAEI